MIASKPVRIISLVIVALVVIVGVRALGGGFAAGADELGDRPSGAAQGERGKRNVGVVTYVLDGDTVQVDLRDGRQARVRFLGISAPEIPHPGKPGECYGQAATRHLERLLPVGTQVTLVSDPTQDDVDVYGRWLRYVQAAGRDIGAAQIRSGSASARDSSTPAARHAKYLRIEESARAGDRGLWSECR
jgi:micrococcal nuclease